MSQQIHAPLRGLSPNKLETPAEPSHKKLKNPIERQYLLRLARRVTLDDWDLIIDKAVTDAKEGDHRARDWISKTVLPGDTSIIEASKDDMDGKTAEQLVREYIAPVVK